VESEEHEPGLGDAARDKTAHDLEWLGLLEHLAGRCVGPAAADRLRRLVPAETLEVARKRMTLTSQALSAAEDDARVPARALPDLERALGLVAKGATLNGEELRDVLRALDAARDLRRYAGSQSEARPALAAALDSHAGLDGLLDALESAIEPDGSVADSASTALRDARRRVGEVRRELGQRLGQLMRRYEDVLRDQFWTERDGRFVLPVRSDAHVRVQGIVLGSSASGGTLYVEPQEVTALGNRLKVAEAEVEREVARVLAELSGKVRERVDDVLVAYHACVTADVLAALTRWAMDTQSVALVPEAEASADLLCMRHPLLLIQGIEVVPSDIRVEAGQALVISGPNAGGKTVALKCLGLAAWMVRSGLPLPADARSHIGWFDPVLTDVGDDQSLMKSLSTFSAHVANLAKILEGAREHSLVLLDEVAAGTDPEEGAALAVAVLEALVEQRAAVAVTTHYERLKELGASEGRFVNASVGFDLDAMAPTFRMTLGIPGASSALAVALRYGVPRPVITRAQALLPGRALDREELVQRLEAERSRLEAARREAEDEVRRQRQLSAVLEAERNKAREEERSRLVEQARELTTAVRQARAQLRDAQKRLERRDGSRDELKEIEREVSAAAKHIAIGSALQSATRKEPSGGSGRRPLRASDLVVGALVFVERLGARAQVLSPPQKGHVKVAAGALKLSVPLAELSLEPGAPSPRPQPRTANKAASGARVQLLDGFVPVRTSGNTLDLRGQRVEESLDAIDAFVDRLLRVGEPVGYVLHGHGTGALKLAVRAHLSASAHVAKARPAEPEDGGDAFTVFWLGG